MPTLSSLHKFGETKVLKHEPLYLQNVFCEVWSLGSLYLIFLLPTTPRTERRDSEEAGALYRDITAFQAPSPSTATRRIPTASPRPRSRCLTITGEVSPSLGSCILSTLRLCFLPLPPAPRPTLTCTAHVSLVIVPLQTPPTGQTDFG